MESLIFPFDALLSAIESGGRASYGKRMNPELHQLARIAEDRDGGPGLPRKPVSQKMIYGAADFFIIRGPGDASHATMCVESRVQYFSKAPGPTCRVLPLCFHLHDQQSRR